MLYFKQQENNMYKPKIISFIPQETTYTILEKLNNIAEHYKKQYQLDTRFDILQEGFNCYFNRKGNYIYIALEQIDRQIESLKKRITYTDIQELYIFALLHEIYHAIDYKIDPIKFDKEVSEINIGMYETDSKYHCSLPFEKKADEFARGELLNWI